MAGKPTGSGAMSAMVPASSSSAAGAAADSSSDSQWRMNQDWGKILKHILDNNLLHKPHQVYDALPSLGIQTKGNYNAFSNQWHTRKRNLIAFAAAYEELYKTSAGPGGQNEINENFLRGSHLLRKFAKKFDSDPVTALKLGRALKASGMLGSASASSSSSAANKRMKSDIPGAPADDDAGSGSSDASDGSDESSDGEVTEGEGEAAAAAGAAAGGGKKRARGGSGKRSANSFKEHMKELGADMKELKEIMARTCAAVEKLASANAASAGSTSVPAAAAAAAAAASAMAKKN